MKKIISIFAILVASSLTVEASQTKIFLQGSVIKNVASLVSKYKVNGNGTGTVIQATVKEAPTHLLAGRNYNVGRGSTPKKPTPPYNNPRKK